MRRARAQHGTDLVRSSPELDAMKLTLWRYAISTGVGSAREIARLVRTDDAYRWIVGGLEVGCVDHRCRGAGDEDGRRRVSSRVQRPHGHGRIAAGRAAHDPDVTTRPVASRSRSTTDSTSTSPSSASRVRVKVKVEVNGQQTFDRHLLSPAFGAVGRWNLLRLGLAARMRMDDFPARARAAQNQGSLARDLDPSVLGARG